jgi:hypothetical protein
VSNARLDFPDPDKVNVLQIVRARTPDADVLVHGAAQVFAIMRRSGGQIIGGSIQGGASQKQNQPS